MVKLIYLRSAEENCQLYHVVTEYQRKSKTTFLFKVQVAKVQLITLIFYCQLFKRVPSYCFLDFTFQNFPLLDATNSTQYGTHWLSVDTTMVNRKYLHSTMINYKKLLLQIFQLALDFMDRLLSRRSEITYHKIQGFNSVKYQQSLLN